MDKNEIRLFEFFAQYFRVFLLHLLVGEDVVFVKIFAKPRESIVDFFRGREERCLALDHFP